MVWLTDEQNNGIASATISEGSREVTVTCNGMTAH
jgi:hypothetical protein